MAEILYEVQGAPATPAAGQLFLYPDSLSKQWTSKDDAGKSLSLPGIRNANIADVVANAANTYLTGLVVPNHGLQAQTIFKWRLVMTKTAAGTVAPIWTIVVGTAGTTADAVRLTFTGVAQTAAVDTAFVDVVALLRNTGAAGILAGGLSLVKDAVTAVGFTNTVGGLRRQSTSAAFDTTTAGLKVGLCVNPGTAGVWTHQCVAGEMVNG